MTAVDTSLFEGWTELQSLNSSQIHTVKDFQIVEEEDFCVLNVNTQELNQARKAEQDYLRKYASKEYFSHTLPYQNLKEGSLVAGLEEDGTKSQYESHRLETSHSGIVGYLLMPTKPNANGRYEIKVLFRGTDIKDYSSILRDIESAGAGSSSFEANSLSLLSQVNQAIKDFKEQHALVNPEINLGVYGHSLGGADAQNFTTKILQAIAQQQGIVNSDATAAEANGAAMAASTATITSATTVASAPMLPATVIDQFSSIKKLHLNTANSAGVPLTTALQANDLVKKLAAKRLENSRTKSDGENSQINAVITEFEIPESYNILVGGDGVQATGQAHIFNDVSSQHCKVDILKAHIGSEHYNQFNVKTAAATIAAASAAAGVPGFIASSSVVLSSAAAGICNTLQSHRAKLFNSPRSASFERMSNATLQGQQQVSRELSKKSATLNGIQDAVDMISQGFASAQATVNSGVAAISQGISSFAKSLFFSKAASEIQTPSPSSSSSWLSFFNSGDSEKLDVNKDCADISGSFDSASLRKPNQ
jgi:hypothetical protein